MGRRAVRAVMMMGGFAGCSLARAQTHAVKKPETVVRAVAVYEFTGEPGKVTASRIVPVSVFINGQFEDGGIYLARPVPFALDTGTIFEVERAGAPEGTVELSYERHVQTAGAVTLEDGWLGYGKYKPKPMETLAVAKKGGPLPQVVINGGGDRPHFANKPEGEDTGAKDKAVDRSSAAGSGTTVSADKAPEGGADPDRPTMHRRTDSAADTTESKTDATSGSDDPERPTLKKRTPAEVKANSKKKDLASVKGTTDLNDDPDRPNLHRGKPAGRLDEEDIPPLKGVPAEMQQRVAVSDAKTRPEHEFLRVWEGQAEKAEVLQAMQEVARAKLREYGDGPAAGPSAAAPAAAAQGAGPRFGTAPSATARARAAKAKVAAEPAVTPVALASESLQAYTLSYGGAATYVYSATAAGAGATTRYVLAVAQRDPLGSLKVALASVTDSAHLDRTPWMRLVDAVDAEASNRASLLFELRGQSSRQFALYRVIGAKSEQLFATEPAQ